MLFNKCNGETPKEWESAIVILLFKKGCKAELYNYWRISLLFQTYKLLTRIKTARIPSKLDFYQPKEQVEFMRGFSAMEHIHAVRTLIETPTEYRILLWPSLIFVVLLTIRIDI